VRLLGITRKLKHATVVESHPHPRAEGSGSSSTNVNVDRPSGRAGLASRLISLLARNARVLAVAGLVGKLATLATAVVLARGLGEREFGRYVVAIAFASLLGVFVEFGTGGYLVREVARNPRLLPRTTGLVLWLRVAFGVTAVAAAVLLPPLLGYEHETSVAIVLFTVAASVRALGATFLSALQALERLEDVAVVQAQQALVGAGAATSVIALGGGLLAVSWVAVAIAVASVPWSWKRLNAVWSDSIEFHVVAVRGALPVVASFSAVVLFSTAITYFDSLLVYAFEGDDQTGLYGAAYRILLALYFFPTIYSTALVRSMSQLASTNKETLAWLYSRVVCHLTVAALPIALYGLVGSHVLLQTMYGEPYTDADGALALLLLSVVFTFPAWIASTTAYAAGAERRIAAIVAASFTFNVTANLLAIPAWGVEGAAAVNVFTEALTLALLLVVLQRWGVRLNWLPAVGKPLLAIAPSAVLVLALTAMPLAARLVIGAAAYVAGLLLLRTFDAHDLEFVRALGRFGGTRAQVGVES
jgi:O-antigen/teichoic acid export membrane protein